ncbi:MAG: diaminopimelate dehydrogenase [Andreesenia angusta]|nr:diaminopimelate dehydrogenase [Andreesenia angusta]
MSKIKIGIVGYGNLGKGVEKAVEKTDDMEVVAVFTRRDPATLKSKANAVSIEDIEKYKGEIDLMMLCGGSATDLEVQGPAIAKMFNTVDSFDTHAKIPEYFEKMNEVSSSNGNLSLISTGWDPGLFSLSRLLGQSILLEGHDYTFWGKGVSQGHSDAIRRLEGVKRGVQYTVPNEEALDRIRAGEVLELSTAEKHTRECYIVVEEGADKEKIESEIVNMPNYFADYNTTVHFISDEEFDKNHLGMPHGGSVFRTGTTGDGNRQVIEFKLNLDSNPEFTSSVAVAFCRAVYRLAKDGKTGALTVFDIPFGLLSPKSPEELRKELL